MTIAEYVPKGRGRGDSHTECTMLSPQSDGWNHVRPTADIIQKSGIMPGDPIRIYRDDKDLVFEKKVGSPVTAKAYPHGNGMQMSWLNERLPVSFERGIGVKFPQATATKGRIVLPSVWQ